MIYGISLLLLLLGLVLGVPALRNLIRFRSIRRNSRKTTGQVISADSVLGWLWTAGFGSSTRPLIRYQSPSGSEFKLEIVDSSMFTNRRYTTGMPVEVIFDVDMPGRAFAGLEWGSALRDLWAAVGALVLAAALWITGLVFHLPF
jgi:hypothetical protein